MSSGPGTTSRVGGRWLRLAAVVFATAGCEAAVVSPPPARNTGGDTGSGDKPDAAAASRDAARTMEPDFGLPPAPDGGGAPAMTAACPGSSTKTPTSCATAGAVIDPRYAGQYTCFDLGPVPGMPPSKYGGLTLTRDRCSTKLLIGGDANDPTGKLYAVTATRDATGHISGFTGSATVYADAPYNDGGVVYGPNDVLFLTHWPANELQQTKAGSTKVDKLIDLEAMVENASASANFVPMSFGGGGSFKLMSWSGGLWYTVALKPDAQGTFDIASVKHEVTLPGGPEGFVYVAAGSPQFTVNSLLVSEWTANSIATYEVDAQGNPKLETRRPFITGLHGAEGAFRDPATGDFFFSTWNAGQADRVIVVRGFDRIFE